jgi:hypothetical protein
MRAWVALLIVGCGHAAIPIQTVDTAQALRVLPHGARPKRMTGGAGWYYFVVYDTCHSVAVDDADVVTQPDGTLARDKRIDRAQLGHYYIQARRRPRVVDATNGFECGDIPTRPPSLYKRAPDIALPLGPEGMIVVPIRAWLAYDTYYFADIEGGADDGVRGKGVLLDAAGRPIPDVAVDVKVGDRYTAQGYLTGDVATATTAWAVAFPRGPVPAPPIDVHIIDRWRRGDDTLVEFDRGWTDGIALGWRGAFGAEVVEVEGAHGVARLVGTTLESILRIDHLTLAPAPTRLPSASI